jgi:hypothetical protein
MRARLWHEEQLQDSGAIGPIVPFRGVDVVGSRPMLSNRNGTKKLGPKLSLQSARKAFLLENEV